MNVEQVQSTQGFIPSLADGRTYQGGAIANDLFDFASPAYVGAGQDVIAEPDRRQGVSDLERACQMLAHAVQYLTSEQRAGRCTSVRSNRQAVALLCDSAAELEQFERREPARTALVRLRQKLRSL